jgi:FixJ family two-component response regulator
LASYAPGRFGCLILDVRMRGGLNGLELLQYLRVSGDAVPTIFLSGHADVVFREAALAAGALRIFEKPVAYEDLIPSLRLALSAKA